MPTAWPKRGSAKYSQNSCTNNDVPRNISIKNIDTLLAVQLLESFPMPKAKATKAPRMVKYTVSCIVTQAPCSNGVLSIIHSTVGFYALFVAQMFGGLVA